jgi:hypothetical protein
MSNLEKDYIASYIFDDMIAKSLGISELSTMARKEKRMRSYMSNKWDEVSRRAIKKAVSMVKSGKKHNAIIKEVNKIYENWSKYVSKVVSKELKDIYRLGRNVGYKKATGKIKESLRYGTPKFELTKVTKEKESIFPIYDLVDFGAIEAIEEHQFYWVGAHYDSHISSAIAKTIRETILEAGENTAIAGDLLRERLEDVSQNIRIPGGFNGTSKQYFEGFAANVTTTSRVFSQLRSFEEAGATEYTISNPSDQRTCPRCSHLDGKVFSVDSGLNQMNKIISAKSPEDIKKIQPWLTEKQILDISSTPGKIDGKAGIDDSRALVRAGLALPPYHYRCRCTVDISI